MDAEQSMKKNSPEAVNWLALMVLIIGTFMAVLDSSIVTVALPKMMAVFGVSATSIEWILTAYMLTMGIVIPLSGFLGDNFGYKRCFFASMALFTIGSALCVVAWNLDSLIAARVIQALGGGLIMPLSMAMLYKICPRERIGMVMGIWGISAMAAPAIGPLLGGYLVQYVDWRVIFSINVPIGVTNLFLVTRLLKETELIRGEKFDLHGIILSTIGFFTLLLALDQSSSRGWSDPWIEILLLIAAVSLIVFVINELLVPEPILDLRLFANPIFAMTNVISWVLQVGLNGALFLEPILIQNVLGQTAMTSGLITFPAAIAMGAMMPISGWIYDRHGVRTIAIIGMAVAVWTTYMMHTFNAFTAFSAMTAWMMVRGVGLGLGAMPLMTAGMNTVPKQLVGRASSLSEVSNQIFSSLGIAGLATIMQNREIFHYALLAQSVNRSSAAFYKIQNTLGGTAVQHGMGAATGQSLSMAAIYGQVATLSAVQAIDDCFIVAAAACAIGLVICFFLKESRTPAREEAPDLRFRDAGDYLDA